MSPRPNIDFYPVNRIPCYLQCAYIYMGTLERVYPSLKDATSLDSKYRSLYIEE